MTNENKTHRDGAANSGLRQYELDARTLREKTERLKALRLARAAAEPADATKSAKPKVVGAKTTISGKPAAVRGAAAPRAAKRGSGKAAKSTGSLSEWLSDQEALGRKP